MKTYCWCAAPCRDPAAHTFSFAGRKTPRKRSSDYAGRGCSQSGWQEGRASGARRRGVWREGESAPAARSFALVSARFARGHAQDQGQERSQRRGPQALAAEGHGPRACRLDSLAALAPWRHGAWTEAARLQLRAAEEDVAGRAALGAFGEARGAETDCCG